LVAQDVADLFARELGADIWRHAQHGAERVVLVEI
jgi:hypothetical protein